MIILFHSLKSWNELFKKVVNECSLSDDPEMRAFAKIATEQTFTPHSMRHWYSVYVALNTNNAIELKEWRGDKAIESVEPYLTDKAMIKGRVKNAVNKLSDYTRSMADTIWGGN